MTGATRWTPAGQVLASQFALGVSDRDGQGTGEESGLIPCGCIGLSPPWVAPTAQAVSRRRCSAGAATL